MDLDQRISLMEKLGNYIRSNDEELQQACLQAEQQNPWFTQAFISLSLKNIATHYLQKKILIDWVAHYSFVQQPPKIVGLTLAGNIPLVGFHDLLCVFISGHKAAIKLSSKDEKLFTYIITKLIKWEPKAATFLDIRQDLKNCDAYIATGSNNSARYFAYYFQKYPHIFRRNRTSAAILTGGETEKDLSLLAEDMMLYYGMGCRNLSHVFVPNGYDFIPLMNALKAYHFYLDAHKYKNNYDYRLALLLMNGVKYMDAGGILLLENDSLFAPMSCIHYSYYDHREKLLENLKQQEDLQCIVGDGGTPFGSAQSPSITDYADGVDTMQFLCSL